MSLVPVVEFEMLLTRFQPSKVVPSNHRHPILVERCVSHLRQQISIHSRCKWVYHQDIQMSTICRAEVEQYAHSFEYDLAPLSADALAWWQLTRHFLLELVSRAGFPVQQQKLLLEFYYCFIVPNLGPPPSATGLLNSWRSFMTDDFTPIEFSWSWGNADAVIDRRVRFSVEPIGYDAGTSKDPVNTAASCELIRQLSETLGGLELQWFHWLYEKMRAESSEYSPVMPTHQASLSSIFLGFELGESEPLVKAYLLPSMKDHTSETMTSSIVCRTLRAFAIETSSETVADLVKFLETEGNALHLAPFMIAIDCISQQARLKVYIRSRDTSFASVRNILTKFEEPALISNELEELCDLWRRLFRLDKDFAHNAQLRPTDHQTSGILYYLEVRPDSRKVTLKVYLPVKDYGTDDWSTALGLTEFLKARGRIQAQTADQYLAALKAVCKHRRLDCDRGMRTYIAATISNDSLNITSYLNPEVYHRTRYDGIF